MHTIPSRCTPSSTLVQATPSRFMSSPALFVSPRALLNIIPGLLNVIPSEAEGSEPPIPQPRQTPPPTPSIVFPDADRGPRGRGYPNNPLQNHTPTLAESPCRGASCGHPPRWTGGAAIPTNLPPLTHIRHSPKPSSPTQIGDPVGRGYLHQPATQPHPHTGQPPP